MSDKSILEQIEDNREQFESQLNEKYGTIFEVFNDLLNFSYRTLTKIDFVEYGENYFPKMLALSFISDSFRTTKVVVDLLKQGWAREAITLHRRLFESMVHILFISKDLNKRIQKYVDYYPIDAYEMFTISEKHRIASDKIDVARKQIEAALDNTITKHNLQFIGSTIEEKVKFLKKQLFDKNKHGWYNIAVMCKEIQDIEPNIVFYKDVVYKLSSHAAHIKLSHLESIISKTDNIINFDVGPSEDYLLKVASSTITFYSNILITSYEILGVDISGQIKTLQTKYIKAMKGFPLEV